MHATVAAVESADGSPCRRHVSAALLGNPCAEAEQRGLGRDLPCDQGLTLAEDDRTLDQARWDKENTASAKAVSASEFIRISTRLSACERTFSAIFCGRCVDASR